MDVFGIEESLKLATSIAKRGGLKVVTLKTEGMPRVQGKTIYIGEPTIYSHEVFMEQLHKCIGAACRDNDFFNQVELEGREDTLKEIIRSMHTDRYIQGEYMGRDRQLASAYGRTVPKLQKNLSAMHSSDPTATALLALGNRMRNEWQGFNKLTVTPEIQKNIDKFSKIEDDWLSLETAEDLENLMQMIKELEYEETEDGEAEAEGSDDGSGDGEGSSGVPDDGDGDPDDGADGSERDNPDDSGGQPEDDGDSSDMGTPDGDAPEGEPSADSEDQSDDGGSDSSDGSESGSDGEPEDTDEGSGSEGSPDGSDDGRGQPGDSGSEMDDSGSEHGAEDPRGDGSETPEGEQGSAGHSDRDEGDASDQGGHDSESPSDDGEGSDGLQEASGGEPVPSGQPERYSTPEHSDIGEQLRELGLLQEMQQDSRIATDDPYQPCTHTILQDNRITSRVDQELRKTIVTQCEGLKLTAQVKKHLLAIAQDRWNVGLKKGKLNTGKIHRLYTTKAGSQPRMYKQKDATKITTDIAISLVVDASGSMCWGKSWVDKSVSKYSVACASAIGMAECLQSMKIPVEIVMFTTNGMATVHTVVRSFGESHVSRDRMIDRFSRDNLIFQENADGESIMWAAQRISPRKEAEKLLIVLSDGAPSAMVAPASSLRRYTRDVIATIEEAKGMDILGLGILDDNVSRFYKRHKVLNELSELESVFMDLLKQKLIK